MSFNHANNTAYNRRFSHDGCGSNFICKIQFADTDDDRAHSTSLSNPTIPHTYAYAFWNVFYISPIVGRFSAAVQCLSSHEKNERL